MADWAWMALGYGMMGLLVECIFTGLSSWIDRDAAGTCKTYLCMVPLYALAGLTLHWIKLWWPLHILLAGLVYVPIIYAYEFAYGWLWRKFSGRCPWDYGNNGWSIKGLIRLDYAPAWYGLALAFDPISSVFERALRVLL